MNHHAQSLERLSRLLNALESEILKVPDAEVIATLDAAGSGVDDVSCLLVAQIAKHHGHIISATHKISKKVRQRRSATAKNNGSRIALLRRLLVARPELSPQLHAVLSDGRTPSAQDVEKLIAELVRSGLLSKDEFST
jgi:hypothetical protein